MGIDARVRQRLSRIALVIAAAVVPSSGVLGQGIRPLPVRIDPRSAASAGRLEAVTLYDSAYRRPRMVWVYTPRDYAAHPGQSYPLMVAFDGVEYQDTMPLSLILDTLQQTGKAPAFVAVLVDNGGGTERIGDLGNAPRMVEFLSRQLIPWVRGRYRVTTDPRRVIITGSSAGGLAASHAAFERPDLFGNVLSQSGAFWRGADASNDAPFEWLTQEVVRAPRRAVRFLLDVGELEDHPTLGGRGPNFRDATRRFRDALLAKGYEVQYHEVPQGQHAPPYWAMRLPADIVALTASWEAR